MESKNVIKLPEHCKLLAEFGDYVLAERTFNVGEISNIEYITWYKDPKGGVVLGHYFGDNQQAAKENFAKRSRLVIESKLFDDDELSVLYRGLIEYEKNGAVDYNDKELCGHIENVRDKLERIPDVDIEKYSRISVLILEPDKQPYEKNMICELYDYSEEVDGYIDETYPFNDTAVALTNMSGETSGLPFNRTINGQDYYGTIIIANTNDSDNIISLTEQQKAEYLEMFKQQPAKDDFKKSIDRLVSTPGSNATQSKNNYIER